MNNEAIRECIAEKWRSKLRGDASTFEVPIERLREIEWGVPAQEASGREGEWMCPVCDAFEVDGHSPDCWLGNLLGSSEAEDD